MIAYRLTRSKYANDLAGTGGLYASGRCNHKGTPVIYAALQPSLALAEVLAHLDFDDVPLDYVLVTIEIPDTVLKRQATPDEALALSANPPVPVFLVPSVVVPQELNVVIYPQAPGFAAKVTKVEPFRIDPRLLGIKIRNGRAHGAGFPLSQSAAASAVGYGIMAPPIVLEFPPIQAYI